jgi:hypothetical protein
VWCRFRGTLAKLSASLRAAALAATASLALLAASPAPSPTPFRIDITKIQSRALLPSRRLHSEFLVETNKLGQVTKIVGGKLSKVGSFDAQTYGNSLQAFIRTSDGKAVPGTYRLTYDYNPKTARVRRDVSLVKAGGVNAEARGAAAQMYEKARKQKPLPTPPPHVTPTPALTPASHPSSTVNPKSLPDLPQVMKSP